MPKPDKTLYIAKVFHRRDGNTTKEVISMDKGTKNEDGTWTNVAPAFIEYRDGSRLEFGDGPMTLKYLEDPKGNHFANVFQNIWPDDKKGDVSDDTIPF